MLLMTGLLMTGSSLANSGIGPTNVADGGAATRCGVLTTAGIGPTKSGAIWGAGGMAGSIAAPDASPGFAAVTASAGGSSSRRRISMALVSISVAVIGLGSLVSPGCMPAKTGSVVGSTTGSVAGSVAAASSGPEGGVRSDPAATSSFVSLVASSSTSMSLMSGAGPMPWAAISIAAAGSASAFGWPDVIGAGLPSAIRAPPSVVSVVSEGA